MVHTDEQDWLWTDHFWNLVGSEQYMVISFQLLYVCDIFCNKDFSFLMYFYVLCIYFGTDSTISWPCNVRQSALWACLVCKGFIVLPVPSELWEMNEPGQIKWPVYGRYEGKGFIHCGPIASSTSGHPSSRIRYWPATEWTPFFCLHVSQSLDRPQLLLTLWNQIGL